MESLIIRTLGGYLRKSNIANFLGFYDIPKLTESGRVCAFLLGLFFFETANVLVNGRIESFGLRVAGGTMPEQSQSACIEFSRTEETLFVRAISKKAYICKNAGARWQQSSGPAAGE
jgi:hypothetical protein